METVAQEPVARPRILPMQETWPRFCQRRDKHRPQGWYAGSDLFDRLTISLRAWGIALCQLLVLSRLGMAEQTEGTLQ